MNISIPKIIHYCWFGRNPKPDWAEKCIQSWRKHCPDYEIIEWNEDNYDLRTAPLYVRQAYEAEKWAFVSDFARLQIVFENGGIYLDTDVELLKNLDVLLEYNAYFGFEEGEYIATGLGFGAVKHAPVLEDMMSDYYDTPFVLPDGSYDMRACPLRNTRALLERGLVPDDTKQVLEGNILVLPTVYLCPVSYFDGRNRKTKDTISIHWFSTTWKTQQQRDARRELNRKIRWGNRIHDIKHIPNRILRFVLGNDRYARLKRRVKK